MSGGRREEIAQGVRGLRCKYYDGLVWYDDWGDLRSRAKKENSLKKKPNAEGMPEAVRITLWIGPSKSGAEKDGATEEPPMKFQTVARLNLAGVSFGSAISGPAVEAQKPGDAAPE